MSSERAPAIVMEGIGKRYRRRQIGPMHNTLRDALASIGRGARHPSERRPSRVKDGFWALRGIELRVMPGETVGIIGPNGAGKSTLLKIIARITEPTEGYGEVRGRVGSLLEVGTGFHSELTGRENIFLSGAILGMTRAEIVRNFDRIVDFAEVEAFLDTPVKHYSSGMYLRLAFAVAAHLDPDILIVDEVLAVGDERFQRKCIAKMEEVSRQAGRTILFVSHNLAAVRGLCERCLHLDHGRLRADGPTREVIGGYLASVGGSAAASGQAIDLSELPRRGTGAARFAAVEFASDAASIGYQPYSDGPLTFRLRIVADRPTRAPGLAVTIRDVAGSILLNADVFSLGRIIELKQGENVLELRIRSLHLKPGPYVLGFWLEDENAVVLDYLVSAGGIQVVAPPAGGVSRHVVLGVVTCDFELGTDVE